MSIHERTTESLSNVHARGVIAVCIIFTVLATCVVAARVSSRILKGIKIGLDDVLAIGSLGFYYTLVAQEIIAVTIGGLGHHIVHVPAEPRVVFAKITVFAQLSYIATMCLVRWSICWLFIRIFVTKPFRKVAYGMMILNGVWMIWNTISVALQCIPLSHLWDPTKPAKCISEIAIVGVSAGWGLLMEIIIWALPVPMVWSLNTPRHNKVALTAVFALGIFDIIIGIIRVITVVQVDLTDPTWSEVSAVEWVVIEPSVAIICISLPICRPALERLLPASLRRSFGSWGDRSPHLEARGRSQRARYDVELASATPESSLYRAGQTHKDKWTDSVSGNSRQDSTYVEGAPPLPPYPPAKI